MVDDDDEDADLCEKIDEADEVVDVLDKIVPNVELREFLGNDTDEDCLLWVGLDDEDDEPDDNDEMVRIAFVIELHDEHEYVQIFSELTAVLLDDEHDEVCATKICKLYDILEPDDEASDVIDDNEKLELFELGILQIEVIE